MLTSTSITLLLLGGPTLGRHSPRISFPPTTAVKAESKHFCPYDLMDLSAKTVSRHPLVRFEFPQNPGSSSNEESSVPKIQWAEQWSISFEYVHRSFRRDVRTSEQCAIGFNMRPPYDCTNKLRDFQSVSAKCLWSLQNPRT
ncbi:hypothetical protein B0H17DRAFT_1147493 [Mycena rosella]|uniref:Secreted protein n=1 Tax=Mycena rosella TaxID=1033263 RepID=A0AAD7CLR7_MYCRO|nr:hypothetical protein B0H17DRAFT_1147493 [Mycena rosella]